MDESWNFWLFLIHPWCDHSTFYSCRINHYGYIIYDVLLYNYRFMPSFLRLASWNVAMFVLFLYCYWMYCYWMYCYNVLLLYNYRFMPSFLRLASWNVAMFVCYEQLKRAFASNKQQNIPQIEISMPNSSKHVWTGGGLYCKIYQEGQDVIHQLMTLFCTKSSAYLIPLFIGRGGLTKIQINWIA